MNPVTVDRDLLIILCCVVGVIFVGAIIALLYYVHKLRQRDRMNELTSNLLEKEETEKESNIKIINNVVINTESIQKHSFANEVTVNPLHGVKVQVMDHFDADLECEPYVNTIPQSNWKVLQLQNEGDNTPFYHNTGTGMTQWEKP
eukprot:273827_1